MTDRSQLESRDVARAYRVANDALDPRAGLATRNAILAAAARAVEAKPQAVGRTPSWRWRFPLAAAATLLISTVAVMLAQRTEQEMPAAVIAESAPPVAAPQVSADASITGKPQAAPADSSFAASAPSARKESTADARRAPIGGEAARSAPSAARADKPAVVAAAPAPAVDAAVAQRESASGRAAQDVQGNAAAPPEATQPPPAGKTEGGSIVSGTALGQAAGPPPVAAPMRDAPSRALERRAMTGAAETAPAAPASLAKAIETPERWLARIIELRQAARDDEADAELKKLRERHPDLTIPPAALRRAGTR